MSGPIPPHERRWRHPSELAAESRRAVATETQSRRGRFIALGLGVSGVLTIVAAIVLVTPSARNPQFDSAPGITDLRATPAISLEPGSEHRDPAPPPRDDGRSDDGRSDDGSVREAAGDGSDDDAPPSDTAQSGGAATGTDDGSDAPDPAPPSLPDPGAAPLATPLAAGGLGVVAASAIRAVMSLGEQIGDRLDGVDLEVPFSVDIRLADGTVTEADVLDPGGDDRPALVRFPAGIDVTGYRPSVVEPRPDDMVTVLTDEPIVIRYAELARMDPARIHPGVAIIDRQGRLLGLCEHAGAASAVSVRIAMISRIDFSASATTPAD